MMTNIFAFVLLAMAVLADEVADQLVDDQIDANDTFAGVNFENCFNMSCSMALPYAGAYTGEG